MKFKVGARILLMDKLLFGRYPGDISSSYYLCGIVLGTSESLYYIKWWRGKSEEEYSWGKYGWQDGPYIDKMCCLQNSPEATWYLL